ncbi:MAG: bacterial Ig-like domain-containing protein [Lachnospiraceae bacterium]|nr:bacterial Ig-like domain-containing protein [Lachnospiraceae bacterium]
MKQQGKSRYGILMLLFIATVLFMMIPERKAEAATKKLASVTAVYTGDTVLVGNSIDLKKLTVMGLYSDGSYAKVKDYSLSTYMVEKAGTNTITVLCDGVTATFHVEGKAISVMSAYYEDAYVTVGQPLDLKKVKLYVFYSDGSGEYVTDFILSNTYVNKIGENEFSVFYEGQTAKLYVTGKDVKKPYMIYVNYYGGTVIVGNAPKREDFYVSVLYTDNSIEEITGYEITPSVIQKEGSNTVVISYGELSKEVKIYGISKTVVGITAEYVGLPVVIGKTVDTKDIKVTATFNDGSKDTVTNFTLSGSMIYEIGDNIIGVFCGGAMTYINVRGVEAEIIDYDNGSEGFIRNGDDYSWIKIAVGKKVKPEFVSITKLDNALVKKAMNRIVKTDKYLTFKVSLADPELDNNLPMTVKVTVPKGYDKKNFAVLYTPNNKTIMAEMNGEFLKDGSYEFKMFQPGTYIIADCTPLIFVETLVFEEEELTLKVGRNYSLEPVIRPHEATNKKVEYSSTRPQIVSVDENGMLTAHAKGTAIIRVEAKDGSGKSCKLRVKVER